MGSEVQFYASPAAWPRLNRLLYGALCRDYDSIPPRCVHCCVVGSGALRQLSLLGGFEQAVK